MELVDMQRRLDVLTDLYLETSDQDEQERLHEQMTHYRLEILRARFAALEFELRYETDPAEKEHIATERDRAARKLGLDEDGLIDGKESRGPICKVCGQVIGQRHNCAM